MQSRKESNNTRKIGKFCSLQNFCRNLLETANRSVGHLPTCCVDNYLRRHELRTVPEVIANSGNPTTVIPLIFREIDEHFYSEAFILLLKCFANRIMFNHENDTKHSRKPYEKSPHQGQCAAYHDARYRLVFFAFSLQSFSELLVIFQLFGLVTVATHFHVKTCFFLTQNPSTHPFRPFPSLDLSSCKLET